MQRLRDNWIPLAALILSCVVAVGGYYSSTVVVATKVTYLESELAQMKDQAVDITVLESEVKALQEADKRFFKTMDGIGEGLVSVSDRLYSLETLSTLSIDTNKRLVNALDKLDGTLDKINDTVIRLETRVSVLEGQYDRTDRRNP
ncbi:hypothetical protein VPHD479_0022 [Vibrio phage D479]